MIGPDGGTSPLFGYWRPPTLTIPDRVLGHEDPRIISWLFVSV